MTKEKPKIKGKSKPTKLTNLSEMTKPLPNTYKLTPQKKEEILKFFALDINSLTEIASLTGITRFTLSTWIKEGLISQAEISAARLSMKNGAKKVIQTAINKFSLDDIKCPFYQNNTDGRQSCTGVIPSVAVRPGDALKAAQFYLERRHAKEYAAKTEERIKVEIVQATARMVVEAVKEVITDAEQLRQIGEKLRAKCGLDGSANADAGDDADGEDAFLPMGEEALSD